MEMVGITSKLRYFHCVLLLVCVLSISCNRGPKKQTYSDGPTSGEITIVCDESYQPLISVESDTFQSIYRLAKVHVKYLPETEAFNELLNNDSIHLLVAARDLNKSEKEYFESRQLIPRMTKVAVDAVALIVNNENPDTLIRFEQLKNILNNNVKTWSTLTASNKKTIDKGDSIVVVFDKSGSANARYLQEMFLSEGKDTIAGSKNPLPKNWFATNSNAEVVEYVSQNKNAIGVISVNWISDRDDPAAEKFLEKIKVVELSPPDTSKDKDEFFKPYQGYIALKQYPLIRDVFVINREGRNGLGTGFAAFVAGDQGQRIVRLMGMLPATIPVRLIRVK